MNKIDKKLDPPNDDILTCLDEINISTEGIKEKFSDAYKTFKNVLVSIDNLIYKLKHIQGIRQLHNLIQTMFRETPLVKELYRSMKSESINEKMERINDVNSFADILVVVYSIIRIVGKILYRVAIGAYEFVHPSVAYSSFFEGENEFIDYLERTQNTTIYKQMYRMMKDAEINEKYCCAHIVMMASLSPFYYVISIMLEGKLQSDVTDPDFYDNVLLYAGHKNPKTGFNKFEKKMVDVTADLVEKYKNADNDYERRYVLSLQIFKSSITLFATSMAIFYPFMIKHESWKWVLVIFQSIAISYASLIVIFNLVYATVALRVEHTKEKLPV